MSDPRPAPAAITLLIPCHNAAPFLPRLAEAIRAQRVPFAAIVCYDDGSTDDTVAAAERCGFRILSPNANRGVSFARNRLAEAAETEWIHFHDADDLIDPGYLERLAPHCRSGNDVVSCDADWIDETTRAVQLRWRYDPARMATDPCRELLVHAMGLNSSVIRRRRWLECGGCDEAMRMWEDADLHLRMAHAGARFHHVPEVLTFSLRRPESFSHDYRQSWLCRLDALERYAGWNPPADRELLAAEAERAAAELAGHNERAGTERALRLCRRLGRTPPSSGNPLVRALKPIVPAFHLLKWQWRRRQAAAS